MTSRASGAFSCPLLSFEVSPGAALGLLSPRPFPSNPVPSLGSSAEENGQPGVSGRPGLRSGYPVNVLQLLQVQSPRPRGGGHGEEAAGKGAGSLPGRGEKERGGGGARLKQSILRHQQRVCGLNEGLLWSAWVSPAAVCKEASPEPVGLQQRCSGP